MGGNFVFEKMVSSYLSCMDSWGIQSWEFHRTSVRRCLKFLVLFIIKQFSHIIFFLWMRVTCMIFVHVYFCHHTCSSIFCSYLMSNLFLHVYIFCSAYLVINAAVQIVVFHLSLWFNCSITQVFYFLQNNCF